MDVFLNILLWVTLGLLAMAVVLVMMAADFLKKYSEEDPEAANARYYSQPVVIATVILGAIGYFVAESAKDDSSLVWVPFLLIPVAGMLLAFWWYISWPTVAKYRGDRAS